MTPEKLHIELAIPKDWTGKQAKTVWEFLESIMDAIFEVHGDDIDEAIEVEQRRLLAAARGQPLKKQHDDDFPF
jgi:hypothetical protein